MVVFAIFDGTEIVEVKNYSGSKLQNLETPPDDEPQKRIQVNRPLLSMWDGLKFEIGEHVTRLVALLPPEKNPSLIEAFEPHEPKQKTHIPSVHVLDVDYPVSAPPPLAPPKPPPPPPPKPLVTRVVEQVARQVAARPAAAVAVAAPVVSALVRSQAASSLVGATGSLVGATVETAGNIASGAYDYVPSVELVSMLPSLVPKTLQRVFTANVPTIQQAVSSGAGETYRIISNLVPVVGVRGQAGSESLSLARNFMDLMSHTPPAQINMTVAAAGIVGMYYSSILLMSYALNNLIERLRTAPLPEETPAILAAEINGLADEMTNNFNTDGMAPPPSNPTPPRKLGYWFYLRLSLISLLVNYVFRGLNLTSAAFRTLKNGVAMLFTTSEKNRVESVVMQNTVDALNALSYDPAKWTAFVKSQAITFKNSPETNPVFRYQAMEYFPDHPTAQLAFMSMRPNIEDGDEALLARAIRDNWDDLFYSYFETELRIPGSAATELIGALQSNLLSSLRSLGYYDSDIVYPPNPDAVEADIQIPLPLDPDYIPFRNNLIYHTAELEKIDSLRAVLTRYEKRYQQLVREMLDLSNFRVAKSGREFAIEAQQLAQEARSPGPGIPP